MKIGILKIQLLYLGKKLKVSCNGLIKNENLDISTFIKTKKSHRVMLASYF